MCVTLPVCVSINEHRKQNTAYHSCSDRLLFLATITCFALLSLSELTSFDCRVINEVYFLFSSFCAVRMIVCFWHRTDSLHGLQRSSAGGAADPLPERLPVGRQGRRRIRCIRNEFAAHIQHQHGAVRTRT